MGAIEVVEGGYIGSLVVTIVIGNWCVGYHSFDYFIKENLSFGCTTHATLHWILTLDVPHV